jgi:hypothetical protein
MESYDGNLDAMVAHRRASRVEAKDNYKLQSRRRLRQTVETKINTVMIGSLDAIEKEFGELWGQGIPNHLKSPQQLKWLEVKDKLRTTILNNGNNQKRAAVSAIEEYDVEWKRHHVELQVHGKDMTNG